MKRTDVLQLSCVEGHQSIALAIDQSLQHKQIKTETLIEENYYYGIYKFFYRFRPRGLRGFYNLLTHQSLQKFALNNIKKTFIKKTQNILEKYQAKVIISSYLGFNPCLEDKTINTVPFFNIICNARTSHPMEISEQAIFNCVFDQKHAEIVKKQNKKARILQTGWFVRDSFEQDYDQKKIRKQLGLEQKKLTLFFVSGYEGTNSILNNILNIINLKKDCLVIVACGTNKSLYQSIKALETISSKFSKAVTLKTLTFIENVDEYMKAADIVIGKAGPNTTFESVATRTPFFATTHIAGQEDGMIEIIKDYQLGYAEENPQKAVKKIKEIIENPSCLDKFKPSLQYLADYNKNSKNILYSQLKKYL